MLIHYLYRDEPELGRWQSGLETISGEAKPALAATMLPLAQVHGAERGRPSGVRFGRATGASDTCSSGCERRALGRGRRAAATNAGGYLRARGSVERHEAPALVSRQARAWRAATLVVR